MTALATETAVTPVLAFDVDVAAVRELSPNFRRITFTGEGLRLFGVDGPTLDLRIKVVVPALDADGREIPLPTFGDPRAPESGPGATALTGGWYQHWLSLDERTRGVIFEDQSITENTRASYPIHYIPNHVPNGRGGHPKNVVFLTADAFGVLPPIARLTPEQAMYYFLSGYTAKVAGTERGVTEPQATFSTCFAAPFMPLHPPVYAFAMGLPGS